MSTIAQVILAAPSFAGGPGYPNCGRQLKPNPSLRMTPQGAEAKMSWICRQSESEAALTVIGGLSEPVVIFGQIGLRVVPLRHPTYSWLEADTVDATDIGWDTIAANEEYTRIDVLFRDPAYSTTGAMPYVEFRGNPADFPIPTPASAWSFSGGASPHIDPGFSVGGASFELVCHGIPDPLDLGTLVYYAGSTNDNVWLGCSAGTLKYHGPSWQQERRLGGTRSWTVGLGFSAIKPGFEWNKFQNSSGAMADLTAGGNGRLPVISFDDLFGF